MIDSFLLQYTLETDAKNLQFLTNQADIHNTYLWIGHFDIVTFFCVSLYVYWKEEAKMIIHFLPTLMEKLIFGHSGQVYRKIREALATSWIVYLQSCAKKEKKKFLYQSLKVNRFLHEIVHVTLSAFSHLPITPISHTM